MIQICLKCGDGQRHRPAGTECQQCGSKSCEYSHRLVFQLIKNAELARVKEEAFEAALLEMQNTVAVLRDALLSRLPETALEPLEPGQTSVLNALLDAALVRAKRFKEATTPPRILHGERVDFVDLGDRNVFGGGQ